MKYYIIEVVKPGEANYTARLAGKIADGDFDVVAITDSEDEVQTMLVRYQIANIKAQSGLHYEALPESSNHHLLAKEVRETPKRLAGRPPKDESGSKEAFTVRIAPDVRQVIRQQSNQAEFIEQLVREWKARNT